LRAGIRGKSRTIISLSRIRERGERDVRDGGVQRRRAWAAADGGDDLPRCRGVAAESTETESEFVSAAYSAAPFGVTAAEYGSAPGGDVAGAGAPLAALIVSSLPALGFVTDLC
jgi:hypothetical protein